VHLIAASAPGRINFILSREVNIILKGECWHELNKRVVLVRINAHLQNTWVTINGDLVNA